MTDHEYQKRRLAVRMIRESFRHFLSAIAAASDAVDGTPDCLTMETLRQEAFRFEQSPSYCSAINVGLPRELVKVKEAE